MFDNNPNLLNNNNSGVDSAQANRAVPLAGDIPPSIQPRVMPRANPTPGTEDIFSDLPGASSEELPAPQSAFIPARPVADVRPAFSQGNNRVGPLEPLSDLPDDLDDQPDSSKKYLWLGLAGLAVVILGGGYYAYSRFSAGNQESNNTNLSPTDFYRQIQNEAVNLDLQGNQPAENVNANENANTNPEELDLNANENVNQNSTLDSDQDSLTDEEEAILGTDPNEPDSDGDGLYDREEAKVYLTNPLDPDTDGDGYLDGAEVQGGYNPNGSGRLLEINGNQ